MTSATRTRALWIVGAASLLTVTTAWAQTVPITQGGVNYHIDNPAFFHIEAPIGAYVEFGDDVGELPGRLACFLCPPGTVLNVGVTEDFRLTGAGGSFNINGHNYHVQNMGGIHDYRRRH